jgi:P-type conjugative transfer protein TrbG
MGTLQSLRPIGIGVLLSVCVSCAAFQQPPPDPSPSQAPDEVMVPVQAAPPEEPVPIPAPVEPPPGPPPTAVATAPSGLQGSPMPPGTLGAEGGTAKPTTKPSVPPKPEDVILKANQEARLEPTTDGYRVGMHLYTYMESALYKLYAMPQRFSHIRLQPGEKLSGDAVIGDPHRWKLVEAEAGQGGSGAESTVVIMVMPLLDDLQTTLSIVTDRHMYVFECVASKKAYMAHVGFMYPVEEAEKQAKVKRQQAETQRLQQGQGVDPLSLNGGYRIQPKDEKNPPPWTPVRAFSDTSKLYVEFPPTIQTTELPALYVPMGKQLEVINYRTVTSKQGRTFFVVDGLPDVLELRLVKHKEAMSVRITKAVTP